MTEVTRITAYSVDEATEQGVGFGTPDVKTTTVRCVVAGPDSEKVARAVLEAALKATRDD